MNFRMLYGTVGETSAKLLELKNSNLTKESFIQSCNHADFQFQNKHYRYLYTQLRYV